MQKHDFSAHFDCISNTFYLVCCKRKLQMCDKELILSHVFYRKSFLCKYFCCVRLPRFPESAALLGGASCLRSYFVQECVLLVPSFIHLPRGSAHSQEHRFIKSLKSCVSVCMSRGCIIYLWSSTWAGRCRTPWLTWGCRTPAMKPSTRSDGAETRPQIHTRTFYILSWKNINSWL